MGRCDCIKIIVDEIALSTRGNMEKRKPRHNPDKLQNKLGSQCVYYEGNENHYWCELGYDISKCHGNPHNCCKVKYQILASRSDIQKNNGVGITKR